MDLQQLWDDLDLNYPLVETPITFTGVIRTHASNSE